MKTFVKGRLKGEKRAVEKFEILTATALGIVINGLLRFLDDREIPGVEYFAK